MSTLLFAEFQNIIIHSKMQLRKSFFSSLPSQIHYLEKLHLKMSSTFYILKFIHSLIKNLKKELLYKVKIYMGIFITKEVGIC